MPYIYILIFSVLASIGALIGGFLIIWKENWAKKASRFLVSFAAGTLLGVAFLDLLPEAIEHGEEYGLEIGMILFLALLGLIIFFLLEKFIIWHHCHGDECKIHSAYKPLILISDSVHNFIDGIIIAAAFLVNIPLGITTSIAVFFHEVPQEIGDFSVLLHGGMKRKKIIIFNIVSASMTLLGAVLSIMALHNIEHTLPLITAFIAGTFIYIAASDLIPEIHKEHRKMPIFYQSLIFLAGIFVIWGVGTIFGAH